MGGDGVKTEHKPWWQSLTVGAGAVVVGVEAAEKGGLIPPGTSQTASILVQAIASILTLIGARRAMSSGIQIKF